MAETQYGRGGKHWFVGDGFIWDDQPAEHRAASGRPRECSSGLFVYNPQRKKARVQVRFYHVDRPPSEVAMTVEPSAIGALELAALPEVPHKQSFWIALQSNVPVLPQALHQDFTFWEEVPDALVAVAPYPGPLHDETSWVFPDCYQGKDPSWYEIETLSILNPGNAEVSVRVRYFPRGRARGAEETVVVPACRVKQMNLWERSPQLTGTDREPVMKIEGDYVIRLNATGPVIPQLTRRARWRGWTPVIGTRSVIGYPVRRRLSKLWYYPGGAILERGVLPRAKAGDRVWESSDLTWNLLFVHNPHVSRDARVTLSFHGPDGRTSESAPYTVPPQQSVCQWLHRPPWLGQHTSINQPFALTVRADHPVIPDVTGAEFEMFSRCCPGAMSGVNLYPGPLKNECEYWLGIGQAGGADDVPAEWSQAYHLFNPAKRPVRVVLSAYGLGGGRRLSREVEIAPQGVRCVSASEFDGLPVGRPFAAHAQGDGPFCAQVFVRASTRGLHPTRSMYSMMGLPMRLGRPADM
ncbi:MAG: sensory rhodopsin transducer [Candidatus Brocadiia bacterium]|jgi:hypothetical protein